MGTFSISLPELQPRYGSEEAGVSDPWYSSETERGIKMWCEAAWEEAASDQKSSEELKLVDKYVEYLQGTQWPSARPSYRAKPTDNRMSRLFWELVSLLTDMRPIIDIRSVEREEQYIKQEDALNKRMRAWWLNNDIDQKVSMCVVYAMLTTSFAKLEWDENLKMGRGDFTIRPLGPTSVLPLKPSTDLQSSQAVIYHEVKPVGWVQRKYPDRAHLVKADFGLSQYSIEGGPPKNITPQLYSLLSPAYKQLLSKGQFRAGGSAYPMCRYREFWLKDYSINTSNRDVPMGDVGNPWKISYVVKPGQMLYPRGRLIVMAGREVVHDGPNPYWHGLFPFGLLRLNVVPWQIYGVSDLRGMKDLQDIVNAILAGVIDMIKRAVNPPFFAPKTAFSESAWNSIDLSMPGARMAYNPTSPGEPKVVATAPLPGFVLNTLQLIYKEMDMQSGASAVTEAVRKKQVPGGDTLDQIRQAQQTPVRLKARNEEVFLRDLGVQMVPNMFQFYTASDRVSARDSSGMKDIDLEWNMQDILPQGVSAFDMSKKYQFQVLEGSLLSFQRVEMAANLAKLRVSGDLDRATFFEKLSKLGIIDLDVKKVEEGLLKEHQAGIAAMPPKGAKKGGNAAKVQ